MEQKIDSLLAEVSYPFRGRVRADVVQLIHKTPTLKPSIGEIVHNDGTRASLLLLDGTIPMICGGQKYNAPVAIYIVYQYPEMAPLVYCRPTSGMIIKQNHPFVDNSGLVKEPYLISWRASSSTLPNLVDALSRSFGANPPLYAQPKQSTVQSSAAVKTYSPSHSHPQGASSQYSGYTYPSSTTNTTSSGSAAYAYGYGSHGGYINNSSQPSYGTSSTSTNVMAVNPPAKRTKERLIAEVTSKLQEEMTMYYSRVRDEIDKEFACQSELSKRRETATATIQDYTSAKKEMEAQITRFRILKETLLKWEEARSSKGEVLVEDSVKPYDDMSSQLCGLIAENMAIDDVMYYLERALASQQNKSVDLPIFLREVRNQSGKQFANKLHMRRIQTVVNGASLSH